MTIRLLDGWHLVGLVDSFLMGVLTPLSLNERELVVVRTPEGVYCFDDQCAHQPVRLSEFGEFYQGQVVCHAHGARFELGQGGKPLCFPAVDSITMHQTRIQEGQLFIKI